MENDLLYKNLQEGKIKLAAVETNEAHKPGIRETYEEHDIDNGNGVI